jgi:uncharacterized membrane protein
MDKIIPNLQYKIMWSQRGFFLCYILLITLVCFWNFSRSNGVLWPILIMQLLPLLVFVPGLYKKYYRSYSWFCFLLLLYFVMGVESSFKSTADIKDYLFVTLTTLLFVFSMLCSRWLQLALYQSDDKEKDI